jgi:molybdenum cofactor cytidylyltransferase
MRNVGAVILAAGGSSRLGQPKQLFVFRGETLIRRVVRAAGEAGCDPVIVVIGEIGAAIRSELDIRDSRISSLPRRDARRDPPAAGNLTHPAMMVENAEWRNGVGTSIRRGLRQLPKSVHAVVLLACDQPLVDASIVGKLIAAWDESGRPMAASRYANTLGVPALFDRSCFEALLALPDDSGAKNLIATRPDDVVSIPFDDGAIDIDTPEDLRRLTSL